MRRRTKPTRAFLDALRKSEPSRYASNDPASCGAWCDLCQRELGTKAEARDCRIEPCPMKDPTP